MNDNLKEAFLDIDFFDKYFLICEKYPERDPLDDCDINHVLNLLSEEGFNIKYLKKERFFSVFFTPEVYMNFSIKHGCCEFIFVINDSDGIAYPVSKIIRGLSNVKLDSVKKPFFNSYDELFFLVSYFFELLKKLIYRLNNG